MCKSNKEGGSWLHYTPKQACPSPTSCPVPSLYLHPSSCLCFSPSSPPAGAAQQDPATYMATETFDWLFDGMPAQALDVYRASLLRIKVLPCMFHNSPTLHLTPTKGACKLRDFTLFKRQDRIRYHTWITDHALQRLFRIRQRVWCRPELTGSNPASSPASSCHFQITAEVTQPGILNYKYVKR
ncbi:uncharacterized protein G2W53_004979 [Senna tora]|uniref:Uncharacterized protein n=1 Tax=Senna tora TaxID=362788 RepID=A0A835CGY8_9FABA|nr:uncharacterized protein G2W53_004979 [Senna tora]